MLLLLMPLFLVFKDFIFNYVSMCMCESVGFVDVSVVPAEEAEEDFDPPRLEVCPVTSHPM